MSSTSEFGHYKNIANFDNLIAVCAAFGPGYNPFNDALKISNLTALADTVKAIEHELKSSKAIYDTKTNHRQEVFKDLRTLCTKVINALYGVGASDAFIKDAMTINRKIQGSRAKPLATSETTLTDKSISVSQQSYDSLIDHFAKLIELLSVEPLYNPNEAELKITALKAKLILLKDVNKDCINAYIAWRNDRMSRDKALYDPISGLVIRALDAKKYVKSVFGASSVEYGQVAELQFKNRKL